MNPSIILTLDDRPPAILDRHLAEQFCVKTKRLNEARARNQQRFPEDFAFRLSDEERDILRSQSATLSETVSDWFTHNPWAYTEEGVAMMSGCLQTEAAITASVHIIRLFRDARGVIQSQQAALEKISRELLKSRPLWSDIKRYKGLGLNHAEIGRLTSRATSTVRQHVRDMERCGLLMPPKQLAQQQQMALHFAGGMA